jgi:hypothetical protein
VCFFLWLNHELEYQVEWPTSDETAKKFEMYGKASTRSGPTVDKPLRLTLPEIPSEQKSLIISSNNHGQPWLACNLPLGKQK